MEIKELSKGHEIFFNSDPINKDAVNYWLETVPKMMNKKTVCNSRERNHTTTMLNYIVDVRTNMLRISDKTNTI